MWPKFKARYNIKSDPPYWTQPFTPHRRAPHCSPIPCALPHTCTCHNPPPHTDTSHDPPPHLNIPRLVTLIPYPHTCHNTPRRFIPSAFLSLFPNTCYTPPRPSLCTSHNPLPSHLTLSHHSYALPHTSPLFQRTYFPLRAHPTSSLTDTTHIYLRR